MGSDRNIAEAIREQAAKADDGCVVIEVTASSSWQDERLIWRGSREQALVLESV
jgi:hypothetical protein